MKKIRWRYAIGELLIVTIGITVAFALNNWASSIKDDDTRKEYLASIQNDLEMDIRNLDSTILELNTRVQFIRGMFRYVGRPFEGRDSIAMQFFKYIDPVKFTAQEATLQSMKFSGDLKLVKNIDLKNRIIQHYDEYSNVEVQIKRHVSFATDHLAAYFLENIDYSKFGREGGTDFMDDPYFGNLLSSIYGIYILERQAHQEALKSATALNEKMNSELIKK